jgi:hypothetical protein
MVKNDYTHYPILTEIGCLHGEAIGTCEYCWWKTNLRCKK